MTPASASVLARCALAGVTLEADGERLNYEARRGLPDDLRRELVGHKPEILALLRWDELSALRWSGADGMPGITIDRPDPIRRRAALGALAGPHGDAYEGDNAP